MDVLLDLWYLCHLFFFFPSLLGLPGAKLSVVFLSLTGQTKEKFPREGPHISPPSLSLLLSPFYSPSLEKFLSPFASHIHSRARDLDDVAPRGFVATLHLCLSVGVPMPAVAPARRCF